MPTPAFPGSVATDTDVLVAVDQFQTTLISAMAINDAVAVCKSTAGAEVNMLLTIGQENLIVTSVAANVLGVTRGYDNTTPAAYPIGATVSCFVDSIYHNALAAEIKAIEQTLGPNLRYVASQTVRMFPDDSGGWIVQKPDGSVLDTAGTTTQGLQEAVNFAVSSNRSLTIPTGRITCTTGLTIGATYGWVIHCDATLDFTFGGSADGITIDSTWYSTFLFNAEIRYAGSGNAVTLYPQNSNPEWAVGIHELVRSYFRFVGITNTVNTTGPGAPSARCLLRLVANSTTATSGNVSGNIFDIVLLNGGKIGILTEALPAGGPTNFGSVAENIFRINAIANYTDLAIQTCPSDGHINTHTIWDIATIIARGDMGANTGVIFDSGTISNIMRIGSFSGYPPVAPTAQAISFRRDTRGNRVTLGEFTGVIDNSGAFNFNNQVDITGPWQARNMIAAANNPYTNRDAQDEYITFEGGTVSLIEFSPDGSTWFADSKTSGLFYLARGCALRLTASVFPTMTKFIRVSA